MLDASTSPGPASAATRAPIWTAMPAGLPGGADDLAGVQPGPDLEAELANGRDAAQGAADRPGGPVERRQEAITGRVDLLAPEARELAADDRVVVGRAARPSVRRRSPPRAPSSRRRR